MSFRLKRISSQCYGGGCNLGATQKRFDLVSHYGTAASKPSSPYRSFGNGRRPNRKKRRWDSEAVYNNVLSLRSGRGDEGISLAKR